MDMKSKLGILVAALGLVCVAAPAIAHHSFAVEYDPLKPIGATGVVSKVEWTNPHMRVYVDVTDAAGTVTTWNLEMGSPNSVLRRGWTKNDIKVGEKVTFKGFAGRVVTTRSVADSITLSDGRSFSGASGAPDTPKAP
jgi:uncharacterized protein DUF6152